ncbi:GntP family permease [Pseudomonas solani]|uniref:GntP family permease n=1 Tax=Pseudomonas solani TaxID=2731552 RepID=UPI003C2CCA22
MGTLGILISLALLMYLAYRGINVLLLAPLLALLAVLFAGDVALLLPTYTQIFMKALGGYLIQFFPLFMLGAIFGKLMDDSGSARAIAHGIVHKIGRERAVLAIVIACGILTYGGVSLFVVAFAVYPIGAALFREAGIPKRILPGAIALGSFTFTMTALPGTPAITNAIPIPFFGTDTFAAPGLGLIAGAIIFVLGSWYLSAEARKLVAAGEGYGEHADDPRGESSGPSTGFWLALLPILVVIVLNFLMAKVLLPSIDTSYLAKPEFGGLQDAKSLIGLWAIIIALATAIVLLVVLHWRLWVDLKKSVNDGTFGSMLPILNTASEVGYGSVIASLAGFVVIRDLLLNVAPGNPLVSEALTVSALAGITGSASGGMSIALKALGAQYLEMANAAGISPELLHRVAALASGSLDTLPHNGAVITLLAICKLTHRDSYKYVFMTSALFPVVPLVVVIVLGTLFGSF